MSKLAKVAIVTAMILMTPGTSNAKIVFSSTFDSVPIEVSGVNANISSNSGLLDVDLTSSTGGIVLDVPGAENTFGSGALKFEIMLIPHLSGVGGELKVELLTRNLSDNTFIKQRGFVLTPQPGGLGVEIEIPGDSNQIFDGNPILDNHTVVTLQSKWKHTFFGECGIIGWCSDDHIGSVVPPFVGWKFSVPIGEDPMNPLAGEFIDQVRIISTNDFEIDSVLLKIPEPSSAILLGLSLAVAALCNPVRPTTSLRCSDPPNPNSLR